MHMHATNLRKQNFAETNEGEGKITVNKDKN